MHDPGSFQRHSEPALWPPSFSPASKHKRLETRHVRGAKGMVSFWILVLSPLDGVAHLKRAGGRQARRIRGQPRRRGGNAVPMLMTERPGITNVFHERSVFSISTAGPLPAPGYAALAAARPSLSGPDKLQRQQFMPIYITYNQEKKIQELAASISKREKKTPAYV